MTLFDQPLELFPLRPRQEKAMAGIRQAISEGHKRIILQAPTGSGKSVLAAHIIAGALEKDKRPLFTVPQISLIDQTIRRFESQGIADIGVIQADHPRTNGDARVQIASIQTLVRRPLPAIDFVLIDEIHLQFDALNKILDSDEWKDKIVIGLSATPWVKGMGLRWTKLVPFGTTMELIDEGWLTPVRAFGVPEQYAPDRSKVHTNFDGDFVEKEAEKAMSSVIIVGNVVKTWLEKGPGRNTFMFCVNRSHAKRMKEEFEAAGVPCGYIDGTMDAEQREQVFQQYRAGEIKIISSVGCLIVGVDERVECIIFLVLTKSEIKWVQAGGRGLRLAEGKDHLLLLDHAGTCEELGLFTEIHHAKLSTRSPDEKGGPFESENVPKPKRCPGCNVIVERSCTVCPICGAELRGGQKTPLNVSGELVPVGEKKSKAEKGELPRSVWYGGFLWIARERGYNDGWAAHKYKEKFGNWPNGMTKTPIPPPSEVARYEKYLRIRYAKSKRSAQEKLA